MKPFLAAFTASILLGPATLPGIAQAQEDTVQSQIDQRAEDIVAAMAGEAEYDAVFDDNFRSAVPENRFYGLKDQLESQFGPLIGLESLEAAGPNGARIALRFERGLASGSFTLEPSAPYRVSGFVLNEMRAIGDSAEAVVADIAALPGVGSILVTRLGDGIEPVAQHEADRQMAIGSTFKLYVLSALAHSVAAGERAWDDVVLLSERSFPSGQLQSWPTGAPVTLHTLATLMISNSDNTATDQLIAELGRDAVEAEVIASGHTDPQATLPFLTTREMFMLKSGEGENLGQYAAAGTAERLAVLQELAQLDRPVSEIQAAFSGNPVALDIEWFASARDIARLFQRMIALEDETALEIMSVNPALPPAMREAWSYAGYKGGSEPGVLNLSWLLRNAAGEWSAVTLGWNNAEATLDQSTLEMLGMRAIALAGGR